MNEWNNARPVTILTATKECAESSEPFEIPTIAGHEQCSKQDYETAVIKSQDTKNNEKAETAICIQFKHIDINTVQTQIKPSKFNTKSKSKSASPNFSVKKQCQKAKKAKKQAIKGKTTEYMCGQCPKTYSNLKDITSHLARHFEPNLLSSNKNLNELNGDKSTNLPQNEIRCHKCDKILKNKRNLRIHLQTHTGERPFSCKECGKRFTQSAALYTHTKIHLGLKEHVCSYCNKAFTERKNMKNHERTHTKERPFECRFCLKGFGDPSALKRHVRIHTGDKIYHCQVCHMKFSDASGLIAHKKHHDEIKNYACDFCDKQFSTLQILSNHESSIHMNIKKFVCDTCHRSFSLKQYLKSHVQRSHMQSVVCRICRKMFFSNTHLHIHRSKGCVRDQFMCDLCGAKFSLKRFLKKHMENEHFEALYCHVCMAKFYSDSDLQKHKSKLNCVKRFENRDQ